MGASIMTSPTWTATILKSAPMITPARQFVYPKPVPGEEDAMARGAMYLDVKPQTGGSFLAMCAIGFASGTVASGVFATPNPDELCAIAGGYAYLIDTLNPTRSTQIELRPVVQILSAPEALGGTGALIFLGFHHAVIRGAGNVLWETPRLSWEGITHPRIEGDTLRGFGWEMMTDKEVPFAVHLDRREVTGGGYPRTP
ncbi:MAG: hypothetical protein JSS87_01595 [Acidobacteria bacterium]|nr:hypothetical protein [Acidobacteriota bacterium]